MKSQPPLVIVSPGGKAGGSRWRRFCCICRVRATRWAVLALQSPALAALGCAAKPDGCGRAPKVRRGVAPLARSLPLHTCPFACLLPSRALYLCSLCELASVHARSLCVLAPLARLLPLNALHTCSPSMLAPFAHLLPCTLAPLHACSPFTLTLPAAWSPCTLAPLARLLPLQACSPSALVPTSSFLPFHACSHFKLSPLPRLLPFRACSLCTLTPFASSVPCDACSLAHLFPLHAYCLQRDMRLIKPREGEITPLLAKMPPPPKKKRGVGGECKPEKPQRRQRRELSLVLQCVGNTLCPHHHPTLAI